MGPTSERPRLFAFGTASFLALTFLALTLLVAVGALREVDRLVEVATAALPLSPMNGLFRIVSILGDIEVSSLLSLALAAVLTWRKGVRGLVPLLIVFGILAEILLKSAVPQLLPPHDRGQLLRPDEAFVPREAGELYAFPSGNVLRTTFLGLVVAQRVPRLRFALALLLPLAAVSQLYAVKHWPSDVLGGLLLGWLLSAIADWSFSQARPAVPEAEVR